MANTIVWKRQFHLLIGWDPGYGNGKAVLILPRIHSGPFGSPVEADAWLEAHRNQIADKCAVIRGPDSWQDIPEDESDAHPRPTWFVVDPTQTVVREAIVPSVTGMGSTDLGLLSAGRLTRARRPKVPDRVVFNGGMDYLVGEGVGHWAEEEQRMDFERLTDSPQLRAVFYVTLCRVLSGQGKDDPADFIPLAPEIKLMIGLPVEVMKVRERALQTLRESRGWMIDLHRYAVNGQEVQMKVTDIQAMAQPAGAWFAFGFSNQGQWTRPKRDLQAPIAVCDIGFRTLDLFTVIGGRVEGRYTDGDTAGMSRAAQQLVNLIEARYDVDDVSLHRADTLIHERNPTMWVPGGDEVDLTSLVEQALSRASAQITNFVGDKWGDKPSFAYILFTGGGAESLKKTLMHKYPKGMVLPSPVTANALGLARYAQRVWAEKAKS